MTPVVALLSITF